MEVFRHGFIAFIISVIAKGYADEACQDGHFRHAMTLVCTECRKCDVGFGVVGDCGVPVGNDTVCEKCKEPFHSPVKDISPCVVKPVIVRHIRPWYAKVWLLALVISVLVLLVIICMLCIIRRCRRRPPIDDRLSDDDDLAMVPTTSRGQHAEKRVYMNDPGNSSGYSSLSNVTLCIEPVSAIATMPITELPPKITDKLGYLLNPRMRSNWEAIAGGMGYTSLDIDNFRLDRDSRFFQVVIRDFGSRQTSTVGLLYELLWKNGREDACDVLVNFSKKHALQATTTL